MAIHPEIQSRARDEVLNVYKTSDLVEDELPALTDLTRLVYLGAVMKEVLRYAPVGNLGASIRAFISAARQTPNLLILSLTAPGIKRRRLQRALHSEGLNSHSQRMVGPTHSTSVEDQIQDSL